MSSDICSRSIFSGKQQWAGLSLPEFDFIEAPSQLLEEWYRNPKVLAGFARHYQTGQPIPADLVDRMVKAQHFGEALLTRRQLWLANLALAYDSSNGKSNLDAVSRDLYQKYVAVLGLTISTTKQVSLIWLAHCMRARITPTSGRSPLRRICSRSSTIPTC